MGDRNVFKKNRNVKLARKQFTLREHSLNCWHNWNEHAPDVYFSNDTINIGYLLDHPVDSATLNHSKRHDYNMTLFTIVDWLNMKGTVFMSEIAGIAVYDPLTDNNVYSA